MNQGTRTLKLSILADIDNLTKGLTSGTKDVQTFGDKMADFGKKAAVAFAAAGAAAVAYAGKLAVDGVKAAIADEAAQAKLAATLENVTGATRGAISETEDFISRLALATGVADDNLRPALERLIRSTKDIGEAQKLLTLALDISAGSGKGLETVANALGKAYEGNTTALGKLGVGISSAELKTMSFDQVTKQLAATFEGQANVQAETFQGKMARVSLAFDEAKESLGARLLPIIEQFADYLLTVVVPAVNKWLDENGPKLVETFTLFVIPTITAFVEKLATITKWIVDNREILASIGQIVLAGLAAYKVTTTIGTIVTALGTLATAYGGVAASATAAGTAMTGATAAAGAATAGGVFAKLAASLNTIAAAAAAVAGGFVLVKTGIERLVDSMRSWGESYLKNMFGVGGGSSGGTGTTIYSTNPNLRGLRGYTPGGTATPVPTIPTVPTVPTGGTPAKPDPAVAKIAEAIDELRASQYSVDQTMQKVNELAAKQLEQYNYLDRGAERVAINFNAPVASDPETLARLVNDSLTGSANRTGNYSTLGVSTVSLPLAAL